MKANTFKFHLPWQKTTSIVLLAIFTPLIWKSSYLNLFFAASIFLNLVLLILGVWFIGTIHISGKGITLYHINKLSWPDIVSTRKISFFGLPHILIKREKGMPWSLPVYFVGEVTIKEALLKYAPQDNPLYETASRMS